MRYISLTILILLSASINVFCQIRFEGNFNKSPDIYITDSLDITNQNFYYKFLLNSKGNSEKKEFLTILQIGSAYLKFTDYNSLKKDSLSSKFSNQKKLLANDLNEYMAVSQNIGFNGSVIISIISKSANFQKRTANQNFEYEINIPHFEWEFSNESKEILGYKVKKASTKYAGRKWTAWFTEDIPYSYGPYIFGNLPGMILEMHDESNDFHFSCIGIDSKNEKIYKKIENKLIKTTREKYLITEKNFHENPGLYFGSTYDKHGFEEGIQSKPLIYNPIELK